MNNEASQKLQTAGGAEREARELIAEWKKWADWEMSSGTEAWWLKALTAALEKCANEARLEALEQAAVLASHPYGNEVEAYGVDEPSVVGYKIAAAIRALKAAPAVATIGAAPQQLRDAEPKG